MAHGDDARRAVRAAYVFDQLALESAAAKCSIPYDTVRNWKREAKKLGDDWDKARGAQMIAGGGIEDVVRQTLGIVVQQVQATVQAIQEADDMSPAMKVDMLASLADAYNKLMAASRKMMPETDKLAVATDVVKRLADFTRTKHPKHAAALIEVLEPFADELAKAYG
ncbi:MAG: DNA-binding protein [Sideroxydans sp.]|nr:DNA-binding protein [Sideroxydans sp.]